MLTVKKKILVHWETQFPLLYYSLFGLIALTKQHWCVRVYSLWGAGLQFSMCLLSSIGNVGLCSLLDMEGGGSCSVLVMFGIDNKGSGSV